MDTQGNYIIREGKIKRLFCILGLVITIPMLALLVIVFTKAMFEGRSVLDLLEGLGYLLFGGALAASGIKWFQSITILKVTIDARNNNAIFNSTFQKVKIGKEDVQRWGILKSKEFIYRGAQYGARYEGYCNLWVELKDGRKFIYPLPKFNQKLDEYREKFTIAFENPPDENSPQFAKQFWTTFGI